jgi:hypothetical protein
MVRLPRTEAFLRGAAAAGSALAAMVALLVCGPGPSVAEPGDDDPDLQSLQIARTGISSPVDIAQMSQHMVSLGDASSSVTDLAQQVFSDNATLWSQAEAAPRSAVFGRPTVSLSTTYIRAGDVSARMPTVCCPFRRPE